MNDKISKKIPKKIYFVILSLAFLVFTPYLLELRTQKSTQSNNPEVIQSVEELTKELSERFRPKQFKNITVKNGLASDQTRDIFIDKNFKVYVATTEGLSISKNLGKTFKTWTTDNGLPTNKISSVVVNQLGHIIVGTHKGLSVSKDQGVSFTTYTSKNMYKGEQRKDTLAADDINRIFLHRSGDVYIATSGGLSIYDGQTQKITSLYSKDGLPDNLITDVFVDENNTMYIASWEGMAISGDQGQSFKVFTEKDGLLSKFMRGIFVAEGKIYCATTKGLSIANDLDASSFTHITNEQYNLAEPYVTKAYNFQGVLYILTLGGGLAVSSDNAKTFKTYKISDNTGLKSNRFYSMFFINKNKYYLATWNGVHVKLYVK